MSSSSQAGQGGGGGGDPWAWLGLLKWSLNHVDGTSDNSDAAVPMSDEDREFLEKVMKEGIIDENERMKVILREAAEAMEGYKNNNNNNHGNDNNDDDDDEKTANLEDLLQELRDIVEQIDYARAFCSLKGLPFLLGCISSNSSSSSSSTESSSSSSSTHTTIPESIKVTCLGILATLAQNNPHVQQELLEMGACKTLSDVYFLESSSKTLLKAKVMQAMSSIVRNNQVAEQVFCNLPQSPALFMEGLKLDDDNNDNNDNDKNDSATLSLQTKTLFFLKALLTSDASTVERVTTFQNSVIYIIDHGAEYYLHAELTTLSDLREMAVSLLDQLLDRQLLLLMSVPGNDDGRKNVLVGCAVQRIAQIRALTNAEDKELAQMELEHWEHLLVVLARQG